MKKIKGKNKPKAKLLAKIMCPMCRTKIVIKKIKKGILVDIEKKT